MNQVIMTNVDLPKYEKMIKEEWKKFATDKRTIGYRPYKFKYGEPKIVNHPSVTMAVNGETLIVSPFFPHMLLESVGNDETMLRKTLGNTFEHEMMHDQYGHLVAFDGYKKDGKRVWDLVNIACDLAVNSILILGGQKLPKEYCIPGEGDFKDLPMGKDAMWYFEKVVEIYKNKKDEQGQGEGEGEGQGEGSGEGEGEGQGEGSGEGEGEGKPSSGGKPSQGGGSSGDGQPSKGGGKGQPSSKNHSVDTNGIDDNASETKPQQDFRERNSENSKKSGGEIQVDEKGVQQAKSHGKSAEKAGKDAHDNQIKKAEMTKKVEEAVKNKSQEVDDNGVADDMCIAPIQQGRGDGGSGSKTGSNTNSLIPSCLNWKRILQDVVFKSNSPDERSYATPHHIKSVGFSEFTNGVMYPHGRVENVPELLMIVDLSGSMGDHYKVCFTEIGAILDSYCNQASVRLISFDDQPLQEFLFIKGIPLSTKTLKSVLKPGDYLKHEVGAKDNQVFTLGSEGSFEALMKDFNGLRGGGGTSPSTTFDLVEQFRPKFSKTILLSDFQFNTSDIERLRGYEYRNWVYLYLYYYSESAGPETRYTDPTYCVNQKGIFHLDAPNLKKHYHL